MASDVKAIFIRVTVGEMRRLDLQAVQAMRSRANYVATKLAAIVSGTHDAPTRYPDAAPADDSVVLFIRVPAEFKTEVEHLAKAAEVPLSRWLRGALFGDNA